MGRAARCALSLAHPQIYGARASAMLRGRRGLFALDALEQGSKVPRAEAAVALALNQLIKERAGLAAAVHAGRVFEEDLQEIGFQAVSVDQYLELAQRIDVFVDRVHVQTAQAI